MSKEINYPESEDGRYKDIPFDLVARTYKQNACNLSLTAEALGINRRTLYQWKKQYPQLEEMMFDHEEALGDLAESKLLMAINEGNLTAIIFYLKTKFKNRGYIEGQEITAKVESVKGLSQEEAIDFIKKLEEDS